MLSFWYFVQHLFVERGKTVFHIQCLLHPCCYFGLLDFSQPQRSFTPEQETGKILLLQELAKSYSSTGGQGNERYISTGTDMYAGSRQISDVTEQTDCSAG
jgi:hypothetical protein